MLTETKESSELKEFRALSVAPAIAPPLSTPSRGTVLATGVATIAFWYLNASVFKYLTVVRDTYGIYWPRHEWLLAHIVAGTIALMVGPLQLWLGSNRRHSVVHRILGITYVASVAVGSASAVHLARNTDFGWVFGLGLACMAVAWIVTTFFATIAICRRLIQQHREWMIRSYVVTFGFVLFRLIDGLLDLANVGTLTERLTAASWLCWAVPLMMTEMFLQGRKVLGRKASLFS
jgi:hypothetical protein